jgi:hypothetical protein
MVNAVNTVIISTKFFESVMAYCSVPVIPEEGRKTIIRLAKLIIQN